MRSRRATTQPSSKRICTLGMLRQCPVGIYPGLQKVVQAAGRAIRTVNDQGVVYLLDDRFGQAKIRDLLPTWWKVEPYRL